MLSFTRIRMRIACLSMLATLALSVQASEDMDDLSDMSIEDLMFMEVTSVSKKNERLSEAAAAVYVITKEDIRRSGANHIAEALRMVPGMNVAQLDANKWAVSSRGFNHIYANKLLVLVDGRSVYSPLFSGVHWDAQDFILADIERIEVIRGPGATLWGANAVNGVINIITSHAKDSQGTLVSLAAGQHENIASLRYGGTVNNDIYYRAYAKGRKHPGNATSTGKESDDDWDQLKGGFRADWETSSGSQWMLQGDYHNGNNGETLEVTDVPSSTWGPFSAIIEDDMKVKGSNVLTRWSKPLGDNADVSVQLYYDSTYRREAIFEETHDTYDLEIQHRFPFADRHEIIWGVGYRHIESESEGSYVYSFTPNSRKQDLWNVFLQDEIQLSPDKLALIVGTKVEHNDFTGSEVQPNVRMIWTPSEKQTLWGAVSKSVRTPSLNDMDASISGGSFPMWDSWSSSMIVMETRISGNPDFESEELISYELGYRITPRESLSFDTTIFYNDYDKLIGATMGNVYYQANPAPGHSILPLTFTNTLDGYSTGLELSVNWQPTRQWKLSANYSYLNLKLENDTLSEVIEDETPEHQFNLESNFDVTHDIQFDTNVYYVDQQNTRGALSLTPQKIDSYIRVDMRLGWHPTTNLSIDFGGRNLFDSQHQEFGNVPYVIATEAERSFYLEATWKL